MQHYNWNKLNEIACKALNKFGVHISYGLDDTLEDDKIARFVFTELRRLYQDDSTYHEAVDSVIFSGLTTFDTEEEAWAFYKIFEQELTDSSGIYACIYSPTEGCLTENT